MVRAGAVEHPKQWEFCGYNEIQNPKKRKGIIDFDRLMGLLGLENYDDLKDAQAKWVDSIIQTNHSDKEKNGHKALLSAVKRLLKRCWGLGV